jgi:outer membrane protein assembly factor BamA
MSFLSHSLAFVQMELRSALRQAQGEERVNPHAQAVEVLSRVCVACGAFFCFLFPTALHLTAQQQPALRGTANPYSAARYEINTIRFEGNTAFTDEELASVIASRPSELSLTRRVSSYVATELRRNPSAPVVLKRTLDKVQREVSSELRYLDKVLAANDTLALVTFYHQQGFHHAAAEYEFLRNQTTRQNTLLFRVSEGPRSLVDTIVYYGLGSVADDLKDDIESVITLRRGSPFSLGELNRQNERILRVLRNNGYYEAFGRKPVVTNLRRSSNADAANTEADSITVAFEIGRRLRVAHIAYVDSSASYTALSSSVPQAFVEMHVGDWYSEQAVATSLNNLYRFGLFDVAVIDTTSAFVPQTDSTLSLRVLTKTRAIHELSYGATAGQDQNTGFSVGAEARYFNRNLFGEAEVFNPFAQIALLNVNTIFTQGQRFDASQLELRAGINFSKPVLFTVLDNRRVSLDTKALFAVQRLSLAVPLWLQTFLVQASLPVEWYRHTFINSFFLDFTLDRQSPINFDFTRSLLLREATDDARRTFVESVLYQYGVLDTLVRGGRFITNAIVSVQARGDKRDNPFTPRKGYLADFGVDVGIPGIGISGFVRLQTTLSWYNAVSKHLIVAAKLRAGHTILLTPDVFYVPFDRHFFAGGSNSIRGWGARELRYRPDGVPLTDTRFVDQIVGNASILEGSAELRWNFRDRPASQFDGFFDRQIASLGITGFVDVGNAFNSFQEPANYGTATTGQIAGNLAIAAGAGIRYDTPAGPFRVDVAFKMYDPTQPLTPQRWLFNRPFILANDVQLQIGLGHAF